MRMCNIVHWKSSNIKENTDVILYYIDIDIMYPPQPPNPELLCSDGYYLDYSIYCNLHCP